MLKSFCSFFTVLCALLAVTACASWNGASASGVRYLNVSTADLSPELRFGIEDIVLLDSAHTIEERLGPAAGRHILGQMNLEKEQLAIVPWNTGGPPFGTLHHRPSTEHPDWVEFYVKAPQNAGVRGLSIRMGLGFFAIPKNRQALMLKGEER